MYITLGFLSSFRSDYQEIHVVRIEPFLETAEHIVVPGLKAAFIPSFRAVEGKP